MPSTHQVFWNAKKATNVARDRRTKAALRKMGYLVLVLWECHLADKPAIKLRIRTAAHRRRIVAG